MNVDGSLETTNCMTVETSSLVIFVVFWAGMPVSWESILP